MNPMVMLVWDKAPLECVRLRNDWGAIVAIALDREVVAHFHGLEHKLIAVLLQYPLPSDL